MKFLVIVLIPYLLKFFIFFLGNQIKCHTRALSVLTTLFELKSDLFPTRTMFTEGLPCLSISVIHLETFLKEA